ncbi:MAG TPA: Ku protein [Candidatus Nanopelagicales bacterium]
MWSGNITFGLVHIPVKLYAATEDRDVKFHQVHLADGGRIKYERRCQTCGEVVTFAEIGKGFEDETGRRVIIADEELDGLQVPHGKDVEIVQFVPTGQIDPVIFERPYYLEPATGAAKPYVLLRQALEQTDRIAVVQLALRKRSRLAVLRVRGDVIVLQTMLWPDEVRMPQFQGISDEDVAVRPQELSMAGSLVESLGGDFDPSEYRDEYREAVLELVTQRLAGEDVILPASAEAPEESGTVVDLMAALQESVRRQQAARAADQGDQATSAPPESGDSGDGAAPGAASKPAKRARAPRKKAAG